MLWSKLADWPPDQVYPAAVRRHMRMAAYIDSQERDLEGWIYAKEREILRLERQGADTAKIQGIRESIAEIDRVLRWMRNTDWPFR